MSKEQTQYWKVVTHEEESIAELFLYGYIGQDMRWLGEEYDEETLTNISVVKRLRELEEEYSTIKVRINSPGGSVFHGDPIVTAIRNSSADIHTYADGIVASMAADIWLAGKTRHVGLNSKLMFHNISTTAHGNALQLMQAAEMVDRMDEVAINAMVADTSMDKAQVKERFYNYKDNWLTPEEAKELGLVDEIDDYEAEAITTDPEKMAYGELIKLYQPEATPEPRKTLTERLAALADKIFNRTGTESPASEQPNTKTSKEMNAEDFNKSVQSGELDMETVIEAVKNAGYTVETASDAADDPTDAIKTLVKETVDAALKVKDEEIAQLKKTIEELGDQPGDIPTKSAGEEDAPSGVDTTQQKDDALTILAQKANAGERVRLM